MKESFWIYFFIVLGILVMVIMMLVQDMTSTSEEDFYLTKEVLEASMIDAVDLGTYRQTGELRIIESKFVESFVRRFAENVNNSKNYEIDFYEIYEMPPKATVYIKTKSRTVRVGIDTAEAFDILTQMSGILETKPEVYKYSKLETTTHVDADGKLYCYLSTDEDKSEIIALTPGETIPRPADPKKEGYTFAGWYSNGMEYDFSTPIYSGISVSAKFISKTDSKSCLVSETGKNGFIGTYICNNGKAVLTYCYYRSKSEGHECDSIYACNSVDSNRLSDSCNIGLSPTVVSGGALPYTKSCSCK